MINCNTSIKNIIAAVIILTLAGHALAALNEDPSNKVSIIIDGSGSYQSRREEAVSRAVGLLDQMSKTNLQRWESGTDLISIIVLDAMPEIIWEGSLQELKAIEPDEWTKRFKARKDLTLCTDVAEAFKLAVKQLDGDPRYVSKYLFVFSDLIDEPPTSSVRKCSKAMHGPSDGFPWEALSDVSVAVFWLPANQKLIWRRVVEKRGLRENFALYSVSESAAVKITPPPRPKETMTDDDRQQTRNRVSEAAWSLGRWSAYIIGGFLMLLITLLAASIMVRRFSRRSPRPIPGRIQPLPLASRRPGNIRPFRMIPNTNPRRR